MGRWPTAVLLDGTPQCGSFRCAAFWTGALFFVLALSGVPSLLFAAVPDGWEVVSSTETRLHLRIQIPEAQIQAVDVDGRSYAHVTVPGYGMVGDDGLPYRLVQGSWVGLPPSGDARISVSVGQVQALGSRRLLPFPTPQRRARPVDLRTVGQAYIESDGYGSYRFDASEVATLGPSVFSRHQRMAPLRISPLFYNAASGQLELARQVEVIIELPVGAVSSPMGGTPDELALSLLLNPEVAANWRARSPAKTQVLAAREEARLEQLGKDPSKQGGILPMDVVNLLSDEYRIPVEDTGLVLVRFSDLISHGFPAGITRDQVRLYAKRGSPDTHPDYPAPLSVDVPFAWRTPGAPSSAVNSGDILIFYGLNALQDNVARDVGGETFPAITQDRIDNYNSANVYWLAAAEPSGAGWARMQALNYAAATAAPQPSFDIVESFTDDSFYRGDPRNINESRYYWNDHKEFEVIRAVRLRPFDPAVDVEVRWRWISENNWSGDDPGVDPVTGERIARTTMSVENNNQTWDAGTYPMWPGNFLSVTELSQALPAASMTAGSVTLTMKNAISDGRNFRVYAMLEDISLAYRALYQAQQDQLPFNTDQVGGDVSLEISGFSTTDLFVVELADPHQPRVVSLAGENFTSTSAPVGLSFQVTQGAGEQLEFMASSWPRVAQVSREDITRAPVAVPTDASPSQVLVIGPAKFEAAMTPWINWRRDHDRYGWTYRWLDVATIYDQFSGGMVSTYAIKAFAEYAYDQWGANTLVIAGDSNEDSRRVTERSGSPTGTEDHVPSPPHLQQWEDYEVMASDKWYGYFEFTSPPTDPPPPYPSGLRKGPDMLVGRLPAHNEAELISMVNKVIAYEQPKANDTWRRTTLWIADDPVSSSYLGSVEETYLYRPIEERFANSQQLSADKVNAFLDGVMSAEVFDLDTFTRPMRQSGADLLVIQSTVNSTVNPLLLSNLSQGHMIVSYQGHAAYNLLTHERLFLGAEGSADDPARLTNHGKPFLFFGMGCHISDFMQEFELSNGRSIGELMFKHPTGGAIATYGSNGFEFLTENANYMEITCRNFYADAADTGPLLGSSAPLWTMGETLVRAEYQVLATYGGFFRYPAAVAQYNLLGDPLVRMDAAPPRLTATADGAPVTEGAELRPTGSARSIAMTVDAIDESGLEIVEVVDSEGNDYTPGLTESASTASDIRQFSGDLSLPIEARGFDGGYDVIVRARDRAYPDELPSELTLRVPFALSVFIDTVELGPEGRALAPGERVPFSLVFESPVQLAANEIAVEGVGVAIVGTPNVTQEDTDGRQWKVDFDATGQESDAQSINLVLAGATTQIALTAQPQAGGELAIGNHYAFPNPVNPERSEVRILAEVSRPVDWARVTVYDLTGRALKSWTEAGVGSEREIVLHWDGRDFRGDSLANGSYLYKLEVGAASSMVTSGDVGRLVIMR